MPGIPGNLSTKVIPVWKDKIPGKCNTLTIGQLFRCDDIFIVGGCEDGVIRTYKLPIAAGKLQHQDTLETKGGAIQKVALHNVTRFQSVDLMSIDNHGTLTIFCNGQILNRKNISKHTLNSLAVQEDSLGNVDILTCDNEGLLCSVKPFGNTTNIRLGDVAAPKDISGTLQIKCIFPVDLHNSNRQISSYILASDNAQRLHIFQQGSLVLTLNTPHDVTAMCAGHFLKDSSSEDNSLSHQVALGTSSGAIYILHQFEIFADEYAINSCGITSMCKYAIPEFQNEDILLCAGYYSGIFIYHRGKVQAKYETDDWVHSINIPKAKIKDLQQETDIIIGCYDGSIHGIKLNFS